MRFPEAKLVVVPGRFLLAAGWLFAAAAVATPAGAQELVHQFHNPGFGGNPFYSEYLNTTAAYSRPKQPDTTTTPTADELLASQIRSSLTSNLSSTILTRIQNAKPGETGTFTIGDQQISFVRTATETTVTFTNTRTGVTSQLVIPVTPGTTSPNPFGTMLPGSQSAEQALGVTGSTNAARSSGSANALSGYPPL